jgi:hypothetical protein
VVVAVSSETTTSSRAVSARIVAMDGDIVAAVDVDAVVRI